MAHQKTAQQTVPLGIFNDELGRWTHLEKFEQCPTIEGSLNAAYDNADATNGTNTAIRVLRAAANPNWEIGTTNSVAATSAVTGGITMTLAGAAGDQGILTPHITALQSSLKLVQMSTSKKPAIGTRITTPAAITGQLIIVGLTGDTTVDATFVLGDNDDECYLYYNPASSANWQVAISRSGTDELIDLGSDFAVTAATDYEIVISVDADRRPNFYLDGELVAKPTALDASTALYPRVGIEAVSATAHAFGVRKIALAKDY